MSYPLPDEVFQRMIDYLEAPRPKPVITRHCTNGVEWEESSDWDFIRVYYIYCGETFSMDVTVEEVGRYGLDWALRQPKVWADLTHLGKSKTPPEYFI